PVPVPVPVPDLGGQAPARRASMATTRSSNSSAGVRTLAATALCAYNLLRVARLRLAAAT
ncbi:MAG: hypothetical protein KA190_28565, partial [Kofleriaceae bacterium]|nr:hypothetical protein [Kofleriaceae bacterium]